MSSNFHWLILFLTNTLFTFFCMTMCVELILSLFKLKNYRLRSILRLFPFINLIFLNPLNFGGFLNPFNCNSCTQNFLLTFNAGIKATLGEQEISLIRYAASYFPNFPFSSVMVAFVSFTAFLIIYKTFQFIQSVRWLNSLIKESELYQPAIQNPKLSKQLLLNRTKIYLSKSISSPMAAFSQTILIPSILLEQISQEEFEAVLAHELEHLRWKDTITKCFIGMSSALFWWVPTRWWFDRLGLDQEMACDLAICDYAMDKETMASGLIKSLKIQQLHSYEHAMLCKLSGASYSVLHRMNVLLNKRFLPKKMLLEVALIGVLLIISLVCVVMK